MSEELDWVYEKGRKDGFNEGYIQGLSERKGKPFVMTVMGMEIKEETFLELAREMQYHNLFDFQELIRWMKEKRK